MSSTYLAAYQTAQSSTDFGYDQDPPLPPLPPFRRAGELTPPPLPPMPSASRPIPIPGPIPRSDQDILRRTASRPISSQSIDDLLEDCDLNSPPPEPANSHQNPLRRLTSSPTDDDNILEQKAFDQFIADATNPTLNLQHIETIKLARESEELVSNTLPLKPLKSTEKKYRLETVHANLNFLKIHEKQARERLSTLKVMESFFKDMAVTLVESNTAVKLYPHYKKLNHYPAYYSFAKKFIDFANAHRHLIKRYTAYLNYLQGLVGIMTLRQKDTILITEFYNPVQELKDFVEKLYSNMAACEILLDLRCAYISILAARLNDLGRSDQSKELDCRRARILVLMNESHLKTKLAVQKSEFAIYKQTKPFDSV